MKQPDLAPAVERVSRAVYHTKALREEIDQLQADLVKAEAELVGARTALFTEFPELAGPAPTPAPAPGTYTVVDVDDPDDVPGEEVIGFDQVTPGAQLSFRVSPDQEGMGF